MNRTLKFDQEYINEKGRELSHPSVQFLHNEYSSGHLWTPSSKQRKWLFRAYSIGKFSPRFKVITIYFPHFRFQNIQLWKPNLKVKQKFWFFQKMRYLFLLLYLTKGQPEIFSCPDEWHTDIETGTCYKAFESSPKKGFILDGYRKSHLMSHF